MNLMTLLKPKGEIEYLHKEDTLRQGLERMRIYGYTALPVIDEDGCYTVPQLHGSLRPVIETLVVAVDKQHGVGARLQPSNIGALLGRKIQGKAKIAGDDEIVVTRQTIPKIPVAQLLHVEAAVNIARHIDRHRITTSLQVASPHSARLLS